MSATIPIELLEEIIKSLPVKSLLQCRSVSKSWKSLIDSSEFVAAHSVVCRNQPQRLLVRYEGSTGSKKKYVSFIDDDSFPQKKFAPAVPTSVDLLRGSKIIGTSLGLFCLYGYYKERGLMAVLWNPSIRKSIAIPMPDVSVLRWSCDTDLGFGVCPDTVDPKIVMIRLSVASSEPWKVEVYTLSSGKWRSLTSSNLPRSSIKVTECDQVVIDRFIYWLALDRVSIEGSFGFHNLVMSFDMTSENFRVVDLPDCLVPHRCLICSISKIKESLAVFEFMGDGYVVWVMEDGVQKPFRKLFTIKAPLKMVMWAREFRKSGELMMEMAEMHYHLGNPSQPSTLVLYEPNSQHFYDLGISGKVISFFVKSYVETLLLHGWSD